MRSQNAPQQAAGKGAVPQAKGSSPAASPLHPRLILLRNKK